MSIDFDDTDSFGFDDGGLTDLNFRPTRHFNGDDSIGVDDPVIPTDFRPTHLFSGSDNFESNDNIQEPGNPHLVKFTIEDNFQLSDDSGNLLRNDTFHGSDFFQLRDQVFPNDSTLKTPRYFRGIDSFTFDDTGTLIHPIRTLIGIDSFNFVDFGALNVAGYQISLIDRFGFREAYTIQRILGPNNKIGADSVGFADSGTLTKGKVGSDLISFFDAGCICLVSTRTSVDFFSFGERAVLWKNNYRVAPPGTLPGGHGATFRAIIRWNQVDGLKFVDQGYRVDADGNQIPDYSCCLPIPTIGLSWPSLLGWSGLSGFGDILE